MSVLISLSQHVTHAQYHLLFFSSSKTCPRLHTLSFNKTFIVSTNHSLFHDPTHLNHSLNILPTHPMASVLALFTLPRHLKNCPIPHSFIHSLTWLLITLSADQTLINHPKNSQLSLNQLRLSLALVLIDRPLTSLPHLITYSLDHSISHSPRRSILRSSTTNPLLSLTL